MSNDRQGNTGEELVHDGCPAIIDGGGLVRKLGAILVPGLKSSFRVFEDAVARWTDDEIKTYIRNGKPKAGRHLFGEAWIRDQTDKGSCAGWTETEIMERTRFRKGLEHVPLSGSSIYARVNGGRDNGSIPEECMQAGVNFGAVPIGPSRPDEIYIQNYSASELEDAKRYRMEECYTTRDRQAFYTGLALGFAGGIAVHAGSRFMRLNGDGVAGADGGGGNHAVCVDDIDLIGDTLVMDMPNSWGLSYGSRGRAYLTWEAHCRQTVGNFAFYLVRTAKDDPNAVNPPAITG